MGQFEIPSSRFLEVLGGPVWALARPDLRPSTPWAIGGCCGLVADRGVDGERGGVRVVWEFERPPCLRGCQAGQRRMRPQVVGVVPPAREDAGQAGARPSKASSFRHSSRSRPSKPSTKACLGSACQGDGVPGDPDLALPARDRAARQLGPVVRHERPRPAEARITAGERGMPTRAPGIEVSATRARHSRARSPMTAGASRRPPSLRGRWRAKRRAPEAPRAPPRRPGRGGARGMARGSGTTARRSFQAAGSTERPIGGRCRARPRPRPRARTAVSGRPRPRPPRGPSGRRRPRRPRRARRRRRGPRSRPRPGASTPRPRPAGPGGRGHRAGHRAGCPARWGRPSRTNPSPRILTRTASKKTSGQQASSGRDCRSATSSSTASAVAEIMSAERSRPWRSPR